MALSSNWLVLQWFWMAFRFLSPVWNTSTNGIATWVGISEKRKQRLFGLQLMLWVIWICLRMHILIKYERLNSQTLMKPTVNTSTAGVLIVRLALRKDANKKRSKGGCYMRVPTRLHGPYCCSAPGFHLLLSSSLKTTPHTIKHPAISTIQFPSFPLWPKTHESCVGQKELYLTNPRCRLWYYRLFANITWLVSSNRINWIAWDLLFLNS